jgi:hypothetical protein
MLLLPPCFYLSKNASQSRHCGVKNWCVAGGGCDSFCVALFLLFRWLFSSFSRRFPGCFSAAKMPVHIPAHSGYNLHLISGLSATVRAMPLGAVLTGFARPVFGFFGGQRRQHLAAPPAFLTARAKRRQHHQPSPPTAKQVAHKQVEAPHTLQWHTLPFVCLCRDAQGLGEGN